LANYNKYDHNAIVFYYSIPKSKSNPFMVKNWQFYRFKR